jgi:hypothetical protein
LSFSPIITIRHAPPSPADRLRRLPRQLPICLNKGRGAFENSVSDSIADGSAINLGGRGNIEPAFWRRMPAFELCRVSGPARKIPAHCLIEKTVELRHLNCAGL